MVAGSLIGGAVASAAPGNGAGLVKSANEDCWCDTFYTTANLNMRSGKGTSYAVMQVIPNGSEVTVSMDPVDRGNGFFLAYYGDQWGWVSGDYLTESSSPVDDFVASGTAVTTSRVNFRDGASLSSGVISVLDEGTEVTISDETGSGFRYVLYDGTVGWIHDDFLNDGSPVTAHFGYAGTAITNDRVNFREGPGTEFDVLDVLPAGTEVDISYETSNGFRSVEYNGVDGWIYDAYLGGGAVSASFPDAGTTTTNDRVNFREGPGTDYGVIDVLDAGTEVIFSDETSDGFRYVQYNGTDGWIYDIYLN
jgi:uncharacterized protein YraI